MLSENLKLFRLRAGYTQKQVADALHVERSTYTYYENGKRDPGIKNLFKLSRLYSVTADTLLGEPPDRFVTNTPVLSESERKALMKFRQMDEKQKEKIRKEWEWLAAKDH